MKAINFIIAFLLGASCITFGQEKAVKIISIEEYKGVYIIKCLDKNTDTLRVLSPKEKVKKKSLYKKIEVGKSYSFKLKENAMFTDNLVIRCKGNVFWKSGDNPKEMPYFANNIKDIYIKENE